MAYRIRQRLPQPLAKHLRPWVHAVQQLRTEIAQNRTEPNGTPRADRDPSDPASKLGSGFVARYNSYADLNVSRFTDRREALEFAVGSSSVEDFQAIGKLQHELLVAHGLTPESSVVELGCGVGRLAIQLSEWLTGSYLGLDIVEAFLSQAGLIAGRPTINFELVDGLAVPRPDDTVDVVCAFSVFTHLLHEESYTYLSDCFRVLKPGGKMIFSFLEFRVPSHWDVMKSNLASVGKQSGVLNQFMSTDAIEAWADHLGFDVEAVFRGDVPHIPLKEPVILNGVVQGSLGTFGQSVAVLSKRTTRLPCSDDLV